MVRFRGLGRQPQRFGKVLPHGLALQFDPVGMVHQAIEDGLGQGGITPGLVPVFAIALAGDDRRPGGIAVIEDFQQVPALAISEITLQAPVIGVLSPTVQKRTLSQPPWETGGDHSPISASSLYTVERPMPMCRCRCGPPSSITLRVSGFHSFGFAVLSTSNVHHLLP